MLALSIGLCAVTTCTATKPDVQTPANAPYTIVFDISGVDYDAPTHYRVYVDNKVMRDSRIITRHPSILMPPLTPGIHRVEVMSYNSVGESPRSGLVVEAR